MSKEDQRILVVEREKILSEDYFEGFRNHKEKDYESLILPNLKAMRRGDAETDINYKQPIGYALVVNPKTKQVFAYQRSPKDSDEERLRSKWAWGVGGHIDAFESNSRNPITDSLMREISEEIRISGEILDIKVLGYINYDQDEVSKVHFGVLYIVEIDGDAFPDNLELSQGELVSFEYLKNICSSEDCEVEAWSKIALEPLKEYFGI